MSTQFASSSASGSASPSMASRAEIAFRNLRSAIVEWRLEPGAWITEAGLQELSALGRTPTREATTRLVAMKMLNGMPRNGYQVAPVTAEDASALYDVWESLAPMVGRSMAGGIRPHIVELLRALAGNSADMDSPLVVTELVFDELVRATGNRWLDIVAGPLFGHLQRLWILTLRKADRHELASTWALMLSAAESPGGGAEENFVEFTRRSRTLTLEAVAEYIKESTLPKGFRL